MDQTIYQFTMKDISGNDVSLENYKGKVVLIVNTASRCGLTGQYEHLQALYEEWKDEDFVILGFPANNFMGQEPGTNEEIAGFCKANYGVSFPMFSKISVKGKNQHPLYQFLTQKGQNGVLDANMKWNFQKFLIGKDGRVSAVFDPRTKVTEPEVQSALKAALN
ncbi:MAG: glutathione peroxidase [Bacteroidota bacterium]